MHAIMCVLLTSISGSTSNIMIYLLKFRKGAYIRVVLLFCVDNIHAMPLLITCMILIYACHVVIYASICTLDISGILLTEKFHGFYHVHV